MQLKPGTRLKSTVCETQLVVVKAPKTDVELTCGGVAMVLIDAEAGAGAGAGAGVDPAHAARTLLGKRYTDEPGDIELLCTKAGDGSLAIAGAPLGVKEAKPLPSSD